MALQPRRTCPGCGQPQPWKWRHPEGAPHHALVVHVAGPVIACREIRRQYPAPGLILDRRQTCMCCGVELVRGRWAMFHRAGELVECLEGLEHTAVPIAAAAAPSCRTAH